MNMHRYFSILFFLFSLTASSVLPMQPNSFNGAGAPPQSWFTSFASGIAAAFGNNNPNKRSRDFTDTDERAAKKQKPNEIQNSGFTQKSSSTQPINPVVDPAQVRKAMGSLVVILTKIDVAQEKRSELLQALFNANVTAEEMQKILTIVQSLSADKIHESMKDIPAGMQKFLSSRNQVVQVNSTQKQQMPELSPLKKALNDADLFDLESINQIPENDIAYPTKALAYLLQSPINHVDIPCDVPNNGLNNANGSDCFLSSSFQVLSQIKPFMDTLDQMYRENKTSDLQNEFLAFVGSLRTKGVIVYNPEKNATAVMRAFLTENRLGGSFISERMRTGHQDAQEFFSELLTKLTENCSDLSNIFSIKLISTKKLTDQSYNHIKEFDPSVCQKVEDHSSERVLQLSLKGESIASCLQSFLEEEQVEGMTWEIFGSQISDGVSATKQFKVQTPLPPILNIQLKRFSYDIESKKQLKLKAPISFELNMSLENTNYNLVGIIVHSGTTGSGHYWAYTKDRFSGKWYLFNDEKRVEVSEQVMKEIAAAGKEKAGNGTPYMFFYERVEQLV